MEGYNIEIRKTELESQLKDNIISKAMMEDQMKQMTDNITYVNNQITIIRTVLNELNEQTQVTTYIDNVE